MKKSLPYYLSRTATYALHPLLMPMLTTVLLMSFYPASASALLPVKLFVYRTVLLMTCLMPVAFMLLLRTFGVLKSFSLGTREERALPLLAAMLCCVGCGWIFADIGALLVVRKGLYTFAVCFGVAFVVNFFWQISLCTLALGAALGMLWVMLYVGTSPLFVPFVVLLVLEGCLASARLALGKHTPAQVWAGALGGFIIALIMFILL